MGKCVKKIRRDCQVTFGQVKTVKLCKKEAKKYFPDEMEKFRQMKTVTLCQNQPKCIFQMRWPSGHRPEEGIWPLPSFSLLLSLSYNPRLSQVGQILVMLYVT